jgi:hypothetical protein
MLAPHGVNQLVQNKGIEKILRDAAAMGDVNIVAVARGRELAIPLANGKFESVQILEQVTYFVRDADGQPIKFRNAQGKEVPMRFSIEVEPGRGWRADFDLPPGLVDPSLPLSGTF